MQYNCSVIEFTSKSIMSYLGRSWDLGPVVVSKEPGSNFLSIFVTQEIIDKSHVTYQEFKDAISDGLPFMAKFSTTGDRGPYGFGEIEFDDQCTVRLYQTKFSMNTVEMIFDILAKGKELHLNGISGKGEQSGEQKPLFWASILKGNLH